MQQTFYSKESLCVKRRALLPEETIVNPTRHETLKSTKKTSNTILGWPYLAVRVTNTSPSYSSSSTACGVSSQDSLRTRTEIPPLLHVCLWISVINAALFRKEYSCFLSKVHKKNKVNRNKTFKKLTITVKIRLLDPIGFGHEPWTFLVVQRLDLVYNGRVLKLH